MIVLVIVILLGLQAILWGAVVMGRLIDKRHSTGEMRWRPRFYLLLDHLAHVKSTPPRLSVKDRKEALFLARELCRYVHEQSDPHHLATVYKLADHLLSPHLIKELQARQWSRKINVLYYMEDLRLKRLASQVWTMLNAFQRDELLTEQALRALAQIQDHNVINVLRQCTDYPAFFYIDVLRRFERLSDAEMSCLWHSHEKLKRASVLWLLDRDHPLGRRLIKAALHDDALNIRLAALKVIAKKPALCPGPCDLSPLLHSTHWQEQARAAQVAGQLQWDHYLPDLVELVQHRKWWVRYRAGEALVKLVKDREMNFWSEQINDAYAEEMLERWRTWLPTDEHQPNGEPLVSGKETVASLSVLERN